MALLDFPHKKRRLAVSDIDKFSQNVGKIRTLLNKLSQSNFDTISKQIVNDFDYSPPLLYELMKIIFMKSTTETAYLEVYVRLCVILFQKFCDRENMEMDFKKLLLTRCERQFYKMLKVEQADRQVRRSSMDEIEARRQEIGEDAPVESDYNKQMVAIYKEDEIKILQ